MKVGTMNIDKALIKARLLEPVNLELNKWLNLKNELYHKMPGISSSGIRDLLRSPAHYYYKYYVSQDELETSAMRFGNLVHTALLEPDRYNNNVMLEPKFDKRTKQGKIEYDTYKLNLGKEAILVTEDEMKAVIAIRDNFYSMPFLNKLFGSGEAEKSCFWKDDESGIVCKSRPDWLRWDGVICDIKTTSDASSSAFKRSIVTYGYHVQAAWNLNAVKMVSGKKPKHYIFIAIENKAPYQIAAYILDDASEDLGWDQCQKAMSLLKHSVETSSFDGYQNDIEMIGVPDWAFNTTKLFDSI